MEINTVSQLAEVAAKQATKPEAVDKDAGLADKFSQFMQLGTPAITQATNLVTQAGGDRPLANMASQSGAIEPTVAENILGTSGVSYAPSPEAMLGGQMLMAKAVIEVDLAAKTAGSLSQSINKLVNMQ
ncbi:type III secretion system inner rod subunit SctI [Shewanella sp. VB17]|uniref:type III secretion system inner rod subunit SctI n=1 Tax=Shewanella sp. VB17 TaxID=2739432 RepID=UPI0015642B60|nr:type III secretion system inner rod subunit SctI [Shewanella sp. VB17]NRD74517.1 type III secretion system inner rod subunit SctI [Shewanella sp. VB17]